MLKLYNPFRIPSLDDMRKRDIRHAEMALYEAERAKEHAEASIALYQARLEALRAHA